LLATDADVVCAMAHSCPAIHAVSAMLIRLGYELVFQFSQATPMILNLNVHYSRTSDLVRPDTMITSPAVPLSMYRDGFGNWCTRTVAPPGRFIVSSDALIRDSGIAEGKFPYAFEHTVESLPDEALVFLLPSRYCETERLSATAWQLFGEVTPGWSRVQAICDFVHEHVTFDYLSARPSQTAWETFNERAGVCRDYAHLAIALCRCMNIPARYCSGYLGDIGVPAIAAPMDFAGWFEAYIGGEWHVFDPRNNQRRIGRVLIARGRDAADVAMSMTFGPNTLQRFRVWTDEVEALAA
jgi:transglutaminase-like putative cysteine protease